MSLSTRSLCHGHVRHREPLGIKVQAPSLYIGMVKYQLKSWLNINSSIRVTLDRDREGGVVG